jgi:signal transduction histidine kinase
MAAHLIIAHPQRQAEELDSLGRLTGGIAHRFNNLLAVISGNLEMLESQPRDETSKIILRDAREAADEGARLTAQLLAFGRRHHINTVPVDIVQLISDCLPQLRRLLPEQVEMRMVVTGSRLRADTDTNLLRAGLEQLMANAGDAMTESGRVTIEVARVHLDGDYARSMPEGVNGDYIAISVSDDGAGMADDVQRHAFEPFFSTKAFSAGSGLGLSTVYGFVKQTGGEMELQSAPGHGTTVRMFLPAMP